MCPANWSPDSWRAFPAQQQPVYEDQAGLRDATRSLGELPPLVTSFEVERLRVLIAQAQEGKRFVLQGGDCAERIEDCKAGPIAQRLKILLQMSLVLTHGLRKPVVRIGRFAGQYAKPRSQPLETQLVDGKEISLPSYFGDLVNRQAFDAISRRPEPGRLLEGYYHSALTLNFIRALVEGGFTDWQQLERWDLSFLGAAALSSEQRSAFEATKKALGEALARGPVASWHAEDAAGQDHF